mgnify:CR=1 FL=1
MYAIQKFVMQVMNEKGIRKSELAKRLGYKNIAKGCRRIDDFLLKLELNRNIIDNLHGALDVSETLLQENLQETRRELEVERLKQEEVERRNFIPFLFCHTVERIPRQITICGLIGADRMRFINLPREFNTLPEFEQDDILRKLIEEKISKYNGCVPTFGKITCFTLKRSYDEEERFREVYDLSGNRIPCPADECRKIYEGRAEVFLKGREIGSFLRERFF